jgi:ADP-ribosylglycohydrolase
VAAPEGEALVAPAKGMHVTDAGVLGRAQGCWLGQLAGDALGSLVEFRAGALIRSEYPRGVRDLVDGGHWNTLGGQPTDDSELALMLARSLVKEGAFDEDAVARAYAGWYRSGPFDMGATTARALSAAARDREHAARAARDAGNVESEANGALMRVSPLGIFGWAAAPERVAGWARADASLTHPNVVCLDASAVYAVAVARAIATGESAAEVYAFARRWAREQGVHGDVIETLEAAAKAAPEDYSDLMGWVRIALQNAFWQLLHAPSLEEGVVDTVMRGGDTDTNGCIAGALLGAVHGIGAVPWRWVDRVVTCRPIIGLEGVRRPRPREYWPVDALDLAERLAYLGGKVAEQQEKSS